MITELVDRQLGVAGKTIHLELGSGKRPFVVDMQQPPFQRGEYVAPLLEEVVPNVLPELHPRLRRAKVNISFPESIVGQGIEVGGLATYALGKDSNSVALEVSRSFIAEAEKRHPETSPHIPALGIILHEFFETDIALKSKDIGYKGHEWPKSGRPEDLKEYAHGDFETLINQRVVRAMNDVLGDNYRWVPGDSLALK